VIRTRFGRLFVFALCLLTGLPLAAAAQPPLPPIPVPAAPALGARSYVLLDYSTGKILAAHDPHRREIPASLTKLMVLYIVFHQLAAGRMHLDDLVPISKKAWRTGGSRMFVEVGTKVPVEKLIEGIIVDSGNDATVALAQQVAGTTGSFVQLMNATAQQLGMKGTHFADVDGLPIKDHYSTAYDIALLCRDLIRDFPQYYHYFKLGHLTYNHITQYNRNKLLWLDSSVDGLKTGYTKEAGYCLAASAKRGDTRLISVVMGTDSEHARVRQSEALLNYGFRFFETKVVYKGGQPVTQARVWKGSEDRVALGVNRNLEVTIPTGRAEELTPVTDVHGPIVAPVARGKTYGTVKVMLGKKVLAQAPLVALSDVGQGSLWHRLKDDVRLYFGR